MDFCATIFISMQGGGGMKKVLENMTNFGVWKARCKAVILS
ncbi:hypothetical protein THOG05_320005 [Vibrio rotiferianus]|nr:hypothetical protein THOG05_320005 [Vibrio rotiferianus]